MGSVIPVGDGLFGRDLRLFERGAGQGFSAGFGHRSVQNT